MGVRGADLVGVRGVVSFTLGKDFGFYTPHNGYCKIGCKGMELDKWLETFTAVGEKENYTENEIYNYGLQLKLLKELRHD